MTHDPTLADLIGGADRTCWPRLHDQRRAERIDPVLKDAGAPEAVAELMRRAASASPYLERLILRQSASLHSLLAGSPEDTLERLLAETAAAPVPADEVKLWLRRHKDQVMLLLSLCDLSGVWSDQLIMENLSHFADAAITAAFQSAIATILGRGDAVLEESGIALLAMGKYGAYELNYSSDIDIVVFYAPDILADYLAAHDSAAEPRRMAVKATQLAVAILQDQTQDGYVFRTDLRLRPDPGTSNIAVTVTAAERYYETYGQNWERAAFSKSRIIAGHDGVADEIRRFLTPFIWRKYLDFSAIEDIHSIKRQIHAVKGMGAFEFAGHDLKLGRGGIREVEFYVQTQQLILGGKDPSLREPTTLGGLQALASTGHITSEDCESLRRAYLHLRHVEHRIQMVNDEQTHAVPKDPAAILRLARLAGYEDVQSFEDDVVAALVTIHDRYADLFEEGERLSDDTGSLVFTGVEDHPDTLRTLSEMGYAEPAVVAAAIRKWHAGGIRATRSVRARELLTVLVPHILRAVARTDEPQRAFAAFDLLLRGMPAGVQFFSLVQNNLEVLDMIASVVVLSPRLAREMATHAHLIEALLSEAFLRPDSPEADLDLDDLIEDVTAQTDFEEALNLLRRRIREARFQVTCHLLLSSAPPRDQGRAFSRLADAAVESALPAARAEMVRSHGEMAGNLAVIAMGRLGASALTCLSDLDLIFVYEAAEDASSDHARPLDGVTWFTRYVRRLVTALSAHTAEGELYDVDMALRPSGGAGPAAVNLAAFCRYYERDAWTWEEMALVKARVITGEGTLTRRLDQEIEAILTRPRDPASVRHDVLEMRRRLIRDKPARNDWDIKRLAGGLTDIDFVCQSLALIHGARFGRYPPHVADVLPVLAAERLITEEQEQTLLAAWQDYEAFLQLYRATIGDLKPAEDLSPAMESVLCQRFGGIAPNQIAGRLAGHRAKVQEVFNSLIGTP